MADIIFKGKVTSVTEPISGTSKAGNPWQKQDIAIAEAEQYPNSIVVSCLKDEYIGKVKVGDTITAHLNSRVNEYNGRLFNSISVWKIDELEGQPQSGNTTPPPAPAPPTERPAKTYVQAPLTQEDDLPF